MTSMMLNIENQHRMDIHHMLFSDKPCIIYHMLEICHNTWSYDMTYDHMIIWWRRFIWWRRIMKDTFKCKSVRWKTRSLYSRVWTLTGRQAIAGASTLKSKWWKHIIWLLSIIIYHIWWLPIISKPNVSDGSWFSHWIIRNEFLIYQHQFSAIR